ncbi:monocarboxylate transporter 9 isoform X1 [Bombus affinis]|uniref:Monocarboxylate transporter 9 n=1 Tax=Bombus terrestris TaxID=30195 RepID=A0A9B0F2R0_BOMTE|nr:monocarboxylate transporter 9 [Bombus terrestris]XP_050578499.1 monocarboxylate transporter 9 isoform X1 [Bombus affinis]
MTVAKSNGTTTMDATTTVFTENEKKLQSNALLPYKGGEDDDDDDEITLEDLAPDGGWGWMVAFAMIVVFITTFGPTTSFAIIFGDFLEATGQAGTAMTLFNSVFMITFSIAGLMTNSLIKRYSMRPVGVFGAVLFSLPNVCLAFVTNVYEMAFLNFLQGMGLGLIVTICNTNFNAYFVKKRAPVMSAAQVIVGLGGIAYPICIEKMMRMYGFRGTALMTGAMSLNCIVGMTMMHPVEWHAKKPEEVRAEKMREKEERKLRGIVFSNRRYSEVIRTPAKTRWSSLTSLKGESGKQVPLLIETLKSPAKRVASISELEDRICNRIRSGSMRELLTRRLSTLSSSSLVNLVTGIGSLGDTRQHHPEKTKEKRTEKGVQVSMQEEKDIGKGQLEEILGELLEISLLKNCGFLNICLGTSFVMSSDFTFTYLLPLMITNNGYTKSQAAQAITISAAAELVSKILLTIFILLVKVKAKYMFFVAMICMAFAKVGYLLYNDTLIGTFVMITVIGMVRSWLLVPQPLAIIEDISIDKFASAYGIAGAINGVISILFGPIVGFLKDWTNSFVVCQLALILMNVLFVIPWAVQFLSVDLPKRRKERMDKIAAQTSGSFSAD